MLWKRIITFLYKYVKLNKTKIYNSNTSYNFLYTIMD